MKANFLVFHLDVPAGMISNVHKTEVTQDACKFFAPNFHYQYAKVNIAYLAISKVLDKGWTITPTQKKDKLSSCSETNTSSQMGKDTNQWQDLISGNMQLPWNEKGYLQWGSSTDKTLGAHSCQNQSPASSERQARDPYPIQLLVSVTLYHN